LGWLDAVTNETGAVIERNSFDTWGSRRPTDWRPADNSIRSIISRGYTGHEMLDELRLVHMNGRVYDAGLGRFLSADPHLQAPTETQNFNRYSYVLNNPLSLTDPSGFNFLNNFGKWLTDNLGETGAQIVIGVIAVAAALTCQYYITAGLVAAGIGATSAAVVAAAGAGFSSAFISSSLSGASLGQALQAGVLTGAVAALTAGILGPALHEISTKTAMGLAQKALGHAVVGGLLSGAANLAQGGSFRDGFLGAFVAQLASPFINGIGDASFEGVVLRVAAAAAVGGTAAEIGGGKFANGAASAAFLRLYNDEKFLLEPEENQKLKTAFKKADDMRDFSGIYAGARILMKTADPLLAVGHWGMGQILETVGQNLLFRLLDSVTAPASKDGINFHGPKQNYGVPPKPAYDMGLPWKNGPGEYDMQRDFGQHGTKEYDLTPRR
jgi:RHS repeat-associated protein